jgi:hypothetical protein
VPSSSWLVARGVALSPPLLHLTRLDVASELRVQVTTIRSLSDSPDKLTRLNAQLGTSDDLLKRSLAVLPDVLSTLDPAAFTLGWLFILCVSPLALALASMHRSRAPGTDARHATTTGGGGWPENRDKVGEEAANAAIGHETFLTLATLFIDRCTPQQLHVNPDKCNPPPPSHLRMPQKQNTLASLHCPAVHSAAWLTTLVVMPAPSTAALPCTSSSPRRMPLGGVCVDCVIARCRLATLPRSRVSFLRGCC